LNRAFGLAALLAALPACHHDQNAVLLIVVTASGTPPMVASLNVTLTTGRTAPSMNRYAHEGPDPITFPTTLSAELPGYAAGDVGIEVRADDAGGTTVATGRGGPITIHPGERETVYVRLDCGGDACLVDGGAGNDDGGMPPTNPRCGNGRVDRGETCDTAIAPGDPGGCPVSCDDHIPCTRDERVGSECTVSCSHVPIIDPIPADDCCPAGYSHDGPGGDSDCSPTCGNGVVDKGETCDTAIPPGKVGACATSADCRPITCAHGDVISLGTCSAVCTWTPVVVAASGDNCCPPGATNADDSDCPTACGNGVLETGTGGGEHCDPGIPPGVPDACPTTCDDGDACTIDYFLTKGCQAGCGHTPIRTPIAGDGCCPPGATNATDDDCRPICGNGVVERGESCDGDSCPVACTQPPRGVFGRNLCLAARLLGNADDCSARCTIDEITACDRQPDGCCPAGCTAAVDPDCSPLCGDALLEPTMGEECDIGILISQGADVCPTSCDDHNPCTDDYLESARTCAARCLHVPVREFRPGDGCCPSGGNSYLDPDCAPTCGDGVVESPSEICDFAAGCPGPETCGTNDACTKYAVTGRADQCSAACVAKPITMCVGGDGCCPPGCTAVDDNDCQPICGDGVVDTRESCDRAITAGQPGACARTCDDGNACTFDQASGSVEGCSRTCNHAYITACVPNDGCCPAACSAATDSDCAPSCGDNQVGAGETCDPPSSCPTACPDDGDPCTTEQRTGSSETCNVVCRHLPITTCSATKSDRCCPTGCTRGSDSDC
jgi:hypothetical protein